MKYKDNSAKIKQAIKRATEKGIKEASMIVEAQAKALAPVDQKKLRDEIFHKVEKDGDDWIGTIGSPTEYAPDQEYGTVYQSGTPFLRPAFREKKSDIEKILGQTLRSEVGDSK